MERVIVLSVQNVEEARMPETGIMGRKLWCLNADVEAYNRKLEQWCKEAGVSFVGINRHWQELPLSDYLYDSSHPNAKGHQFIADRIVEAMKGLNLLL